jgi:hypothetical protein
VRVTAANAGGSSSPVDSAPTTAVGANAYQAQVHNDQPAAYWKLDETSGSTFANSGTGGAGVLYGAGGFTVNSPSPVTGGKSVFLNGSSGELYALNHASLNISGDLTLEMWVDAVEMPNVNEYLICKNGGGYAINYCLYAHEYDFYYFAQGDSAGTGSGVGLSGPSLVLNSWKHVAITVSGNTVTQYVNGVQVAQATRTGAAAITTASLNVGMGFHGYVDEVAVYSSALTQSRLQAHYNAG